MCVCVCVLQAAGFAAHRSCQLVPHCVYSSPKTFTMNFASHTGASLGAGSDEVQCRTIVDLLDSYKLPRVDFVSFDIEGAEEEVVRCLDFARVDATVWAVETNKVNIHTHTHTHTPTKHTCAARSGASPSSHLSPPRCLCCVCLCVCLGSSEAF